jgi:uncharacterized membrane-anchored protein
MHKSRKQRTVTQQNFGPPLLSINSAILWLLIQGIKYFVPEILNTGTKDMRFLLLLFNGCIVYCIRYLVQISESIENDFPRGFLLRRVLHVGNWRAARTFISFI